MRRLLMSLGYGLLLPALVISTAFMLTAGRSPAPAAAATAPAHRVRVVTRRSNARKKTHVKRSSAKHAHVASALPQQGIFGSCDIAGELAACEQSLQAMHAAGLTVVVQTVNTTPAILAAYSAYAQSIGMSVMWQINDPGFWGGAWAGSSAAKDFPQFAGQCGCTDTTQVLDAMIQWLGALPGTYGYYAADDELLTPSQKAGLTQYVGEIRTVDPSHMIMVGSNASQGSEYYSTGATIGNEIYPITTSSLMPYQRHAYMWQSVAQSVSADQHAADLAGSQTAFILQAFTFGDNLIDGQAVGVCTASMTPAQCASLLQYPTAAAQLQLRNEVLQHADPKLILWFKFSETYGQGTRWTGLEHAIGAPFPATAVAARAHRRRGHHAHRRSGHDRHARTAASHRA